MKKSEIKNKYQSTEEFKKKRREYLDRPEIKEKRRRYEKEKRKVDPVFKLKQAMRSRTKLFLKKMEISLQSQRVLGCDWGELKKHLESQFQENMSWDNYGLYGWHVDHIVPLASAATIDDIYSLCHYTNLQPLWADENIRKGDKILPRQGDQS
jgi:hypothetical protein